VETLIEKTPCSTIKIFQIAKWFNDRSANNAHDYGTMVMKNPIDYPDPFS
jgi:hypothetical protein